MLVADQRVSCEEGSTLRYVTAVHAFAVIAVVGVDLPLFVFRQTLQLRKNEDLSGNSIYAGLFEWYVRERSLAYLVDELNLHSALTLALILSHQPSLAAHLLTRTLALLAGTRPVGRTGRPCCC